MSGKSDLLEWDSEATSTTPLGEEHHSESAGAGWKGESIPTTMRKLLRKFARRSVTFAPFFFRKRREKDRGVFQYSVRQVSQGL